jgi:hypothetical protein
MILYRRFDGRIQIWYNHEPDSAARRQTSKKIAHFLLILVIIVLILPIPVNSQDGEWQHFYTNSAGDRFFYDQGSVVYPSDSVVKTQLKVSSAREGARQQELRMLVEIDCSKQMYRRLEQQVLNGDGTIRTLSQPSGWSEVLPQSNTESLANKICKKPTGRRHTR